VDSLRQISPDSHQHGLAGQGERHDLAASVITKTYKVCQKMDSKLSVCVMNDIDSKSQFYSSSHSLIPSLNIFSDSSEFIIYNNTSSL
jgi:hypothetical protein